MRVPYGQTISPSFKDRGKEKEVEKCSISMSHKKWRRNSHFCLMEKKEKRRSQEISFCCKERLKKDQGVSRDMLPAEL